MFLNINIFRIAKFKCENVLKLVRLLLIITREKWADVGNLKKQIYWECRYLIIKIREVSFFSAWSEGYWFYEGGGHFFPNLKRKRVKFSPPFQRHVISILRRKQWYSIKAVQKFYFWTTNHSKNKHNTDINKIKMNSIANVMFF